MNIRELKRKRTGAILVAAIVCLLVSLGIVAVVVQITLRGQRACRVEHRRQQAMWLLDAGCLRAKERLVASPEYSGERWLLGDSLERYPESWVEIRVSENGENKIVEVKSRLAVFDSDPLAIQQSSQFVWRMNQETPGEGE